MHPAGQVICCDRLILRLGVRNWIVEFLDRDTGPAASLPQVRARRECPLKNRIRHMRIDEVKSPLILRGPLFLETVQVIV